MKKIIVYAAAVLISFSATAAPDSKLLQSFKETFPNAENVKWNDDKAGYFVRFYLHGNFEKILYNKEGDFVCSWRYSDGKDLPINIMMTLRKKYGEHEMLGVTELTTTDNVDYNIQLSKGNKWYTIMISNDGTISKEEKYNKLNVDATNH